MFSVYCKMRRQVVSSELKKTRNLEVVGLLRKENMTNE